MKLVGSCILVLLAVARGETERSWLLREGDAPPDDSRKERGRIGAAMERMRSWYCANEEPRSPICTELGGGPGKRFPIELPKRKNFAHMHDAYCSFSAEHAEEHPCIRWRASKKRLRKVAER